MDSSSSSESEHEDESIPDLDLEELSATDHSLHSQSTADSDSDLESRTMRQKYDIRQNPAHSYLNSNGTSEPSTSRTILEDPEPGTIISIPVFFSTAVVLPGQTIPLTANGIPDQVIEQAMNKKFPYIGIMMADFYEGFRPDSNIGVLVQINNFTHLEDGFNIVGCAKQRFRLTREVQETEIETGNMFSALLFVSNIEVEVLAEILLLPFHIDPSSSFNRLSNKQKQDYQNCVFSIDRRILEYCSTEHTVRSLKKWLCLFVDEKKVNNALEMGLGMFSFWVAANLPISSNEKLEILVENCVDRRLKSELEFVYKHSKLACGCGSEKLDICDLINLNSESMGNCYVNPNGYVHDMFTSRKVQNVSYSGSAQTKYSWFQGYSWTIMNCSNCGAHMGWKFKSSKLEPAKFFGINRKAIQPIRRKDEI